MPKTAAPCPSTYPSEELTSGMERLDRSELIGTQGSQLSNVPKMPAAFEHCMWGFPPRMVLFPKPSTSRDEAGCLRPAPTCIEVSRKQIRVHAQYRCKQRSPAVRHSDTWPTLWSQARC